MPYKTGAWGEQAKKRSKRRNNYFLQYNKKNQPIKSESMKKYLNKKRVEILDFMEGKCIFCGFSDYRALQVDHINGCGKKNRLDRYALFVDIKKNTHKYQLLCANCNWIKRYEKGEDRGRIYESEVI